MAMSDVILGRLSHVPIVTIAVPIFYANGDVAGVAGGSLNLSNFERFVDDFRTLPMRKITDPRSARSRHLRQRRRRVLRVAEPVAGRLVVAAARRRSKRRLSRIERPIADAGATRRASSRPR